MREEIEGGLFHPMDEGSAIVAGLVVGGSSVLDLAAAPGGKSLAMALQGARRRQPRPLARAPRDRFASRIAGFSGATRRWSSATGSALRSGHRFDAVLLDAPCSATGTLRKNPEVKLRLEEKDFSSYGSLQLELLRAAATLTSGEIIYSTCSLEREENRDVIASFLASDPDFELFDLAPRVPPSLAAAVRDGVLVLTPEFGTDGFLAAGLRRRVSDRRVRSRASVVKR